MTSNTDNTNPWDGHTPLPWSTGHKAWDVRALDEQMKICDIRGWGHLTGKGALGLSEAEAVAIQDANAALIVHRVNKGPAADAMASVLESLLRWFDADDEVLDAMSQDELADHNRQIDRITKALAAYREKSE